MLCQVCQLPGATLYRDGDIEELRCMAHRDHQVHQAAPDPLPGTVACTVCGGSWNLGPEGLEPRLTGPRACVTCLHFQPWTGAMRAAGLANYGQPMGDCACPVPKVTSSAKLPAPAKLTGCRCWTAPPNHTKPDPNSAPAEFRILGPCAPTKDLVFDEAAAQTIMANWEGRGRPPLSVDCEFRSLKPATLPYDGPSHAPIGFARLALKHNKGAPEIWATNVRWTEEGRRAVESKAYRFCVPAIVIDPKSRRAERIVGLALTNSPTDPGCTPLMPEEPTK